MSRVVMAYEAVAPTSSTAALQQLIVYPCPDAGVYLS